MTRPMPWEMEGISMGRVNSTHQASLKRIRLRVMHQASRKARNTEIRVAVPDDSRECSAAEWNCGLLRIPPTSVVAMFESMRIRGSKTAKRKKSARTALRARLPAERFVSMISPPYSGFRYFMRDSIFLLRLRMTNSSTYSSAG